MRLKYFLWVSLFINFVLMLTTPVHALDINSVRFGIHPDKTRLVFELSQSTDFKSFTLPKTDTTPYRLVIDMPAFSWNAADVEQPKNGKILDVRTGTISKSAHRVVIDVRDPSVIQNAFIIPKASGRPDRLVVDFKSVSTGYFNGNERKSFGTYEAKLDAPQEPAPLKTTLSNIVSEHSGEKNDKGGPPIPLKKPTVRPTESKTKVTQSNIPKSPLYRPIVVIDAGHGGADPGAVSAGKLYEKTLTLSAAKELKRQLDATKQYRVYLTRSDDRFIKLYRRVSIARNKDADLFVSIHADSINKSSVRGASVYTLSNKASDAQTAKLAQRENQADLIAGVDLSHEDKDVANILLDLAMRDTMNQSKFLANTVVDKMRARGIRLLDRPHRYAGFAVLKAPDVPSILFEMGFISNRKEANMLRSASYRQKVMAGLKDGIDGYFKKTRKNAN